MADEEKDSSLKEAYLMRDAKDWQMQRPSFCNVEGEGVVGAVNQSPE